MEVIILIALGLFGLFFLSRLFHKPKKVVEDRVQVVHTQRQYDVFTSSQIFKWHIIFIISMISYALLSTHFLLNSLHPLSLFYEQGFAGHIAAMSGSNFIYDFSNSLTWFIITAAVSILISKIVFPSQYRNHPNKGDNLRIVGIMPIIITIYQGYLIFS